MIEPELTLSALGAGYRSVVYESLVLFALEKMMN
jgi:hypothetical protein